MVFLSLSLSLVLERKSNNTLERRRPEEDPKENDNNSKKKQSAFLLGFRVLLKPAKIAPFFMSFSFALT